MKKYEQTVFDGTGNELERLRSLNAELVKALRRTIVYLSAHSFTDSATIRGVSEVLAQARTALAKAGA